VRMLRCHPRLDRVHYSEGSVSALFFRQQSVRPSGARPVPRQPRRHMDTALFAKHREAQGWLDKQVDDLRVCQCMCVERRVYVRAREGASEERHGT
jgi:hypothetical protein